ncbi:hypothetical protein SGPA1_21788 [Streptomyces misionensis JCM 4497]
MPTSPEPAGPRRARAPPAARPARRPLRQTVAVPGRRDGRPGLFHHRGGRAAPGAAAERHRPLRRRTRGPERGRRLGTGACLLGVGSGHGTRAASAPRPVARRLDRRQLRAHVLPHPVRQPDPRPQDRGHTER